MSVDVVLSHRQPTLRFPKSHEAEPDSQVALYWDGRRAPNGDGVPGGTGIDYTTPLASPMPVWRKGHLQMFGGGWDAGGFMEPHAADIDPSLGWDCGPWDVGAWDAKTGWWEWKLPFLLRDGVYQFAAKVRDAIGNEQSEAGQVLTLQVQALPRPARDLQVAFDPETGLIAARWRPSPEFEAAA